MSDLSKIDPSTATGSQELVALIAREWMGWAPCKMRCHWLDELNNSVYAAIDGADMERWSPFINPTHAGEARRKARYSSVTHNDYKPFRGVSVTVFDGQTEEEGECRYSETNGDKAHAEALATMRAILGAMKARENTK